MNWTRRRLLRAVLLFAAAGLIAGPRSTAVGAGASAPVRFETSSLVVVTARGRSGFTVELALSAAQRMRGLQGRRRLAADAGMLFDFQGTGPAVMWMKDTYVPLDMLFIDSQGRIVNIAEHTVPLSLTPIRSAGPVRAVLELNAGTAARLGIRPGDRVLHSVFGTAGQ
ncbi:MAG: DUF192 domain-containing protein [Rhodospirillales bacterium]